MTLLLSLIGFLLLAMGTYRPSQLLFGQAPPRGYRLGALAAGYALILLSLALTLRGADAARNAVAWFGDLTAAALMAVALLWLIARRRTR